MEDLEKAKKVEKSILKAFDKYHNPTNESSEAEALDLLSQLPNPAEVRDDDEDQFTLLHHACYNGWHEVAKVLIEKYNCDPNCRNAAGSILLHQACLNGTLDLVKYLVHNKGCNPNDQNSKGQVSLHHAASGGYLHVVKFFNEHCMVDSTIKDKNGWSSLHYACKTGHTTLAKYFVEELQCNPACGDKNDSTPLHFACENGHLDVVKYLAEKQKCNPACKKDDGMTPLHSACLMGHLHIVQYLIREMHCDPACRTNDGGTPLYFAHDSGHLNIMKYLTEEQHVDLCYQTPLRLVCLRRQPNLAKYLIEVLGYCPAYQGYQTHGLGHQTPLHFACDGGHLTIVKYLTEEQHVDPSIRDKVGSTPLHSACLKGHLHVTKYLIEKWQCNPACSDNNGWTPLHFASREGHLDLVKYLVDKEQACKRNHKLYLIAKYIGIQFSSFLTPLHLACSGGYLSIAKYLIEKQHIDPSVRSIINNWTPLHSACQNGHLHMVRYLIEEQLQRCSYYRYSDNTPLHMACEGGHLNILKYLVEKWHGNPEEGGSLEWTPLHSACEKGHLNVAKYLIEVCNCNPKVRQHISYGGASPLSLACKSHRLDLVMYLVNECNCNLINAGIHISKHFVENDTDIALFLISSCKIDGPNVEHKDLILYPAFKLFVMGNFSSGKSTLVKALQEHFQAPPNVAKRVTRSYQNVSEVELCTAGIISVDIQIQNCGRLIMYDFAGQAEYYSSHAAICENLMTSEGCLIIVVFNLSKDLKECVPELQYWQSFVDNQLRSAIHYPPIIFVASHADVVQSQHLDPAQKAKQVVQTSFGDKCSHEVIFLDCRKKYSPGLQTISQSVIKYCTIYQDRSVVEINIHLLLYFIRWHFKRTVACLLDTVFQLIVSLYKNKFHNKNCQLPESIDQLSDLLVVLNESGELLFLKNDKDVCNSWIILKIAALFSEINGRIFAPENFKYHHDISNSTGVVPLSNIRKLFPHYDPQMLIGFMIHLELCHEIYKSEAKLINTETLISAANSTQDSETFYFFPALVKVELSTETVFSQTNHYKHGWCLQRVNEPQCLTSRFLHTLLLRLAFTFALQCEQEAHSIVIQRECNVWKKGIHWLNKDGIEVVVEVVEQSTAVVVVFGCIERNVTKCLQLRSAIVHMVLSTVKQFCGAVELKEYVVDPCELDLYPLRKVDDLFKYSMNRLALAIKDQKDIITVKVGENVKRIEIDELLYFEPYTCLSEKLIVHLHSGDDNLNQPIPDSFLLDCATSAYLKQFKLKEILPISESELAVALALAQHDGQYKENKPHQCFLLLRTWRDGNEKTNFIGLRELLDSFSIFCGRNPLDFVSESPHSV